MSRRARWSDDRCRSIHGCVLPGCAAPAGAPGRPKQARADASAVSAPRPRPDRGTRLGRRRVGGPSTVPGTDRSRRRPLIAPRPRLAIRRLGPTSRLTTAGTCERVITVATRDLARRVWQRPVRLSQTRKTARSPGWPRSRSRTTRSGWSRRPRQAPGIRRCRRCAHSGGPGRGLSPGRPGNPRRR